MSAKKKTTDASSLRKRAEQDLAKKNISHPREIDADTRRLLHELDVHPIELELQNTELRQARDDAEAMGLKYSDLYDFAPVGYFTLSRDSTVLMVNLTGATLTGVVRSLLIGRRLQTLLPAADRENFDDFLAHVFSDEDQHETDSYLVPENKSPMPVTIRARRSPDGRECLAAITDTTEATDARIEQAQLLADSQEHERRLRELSHQLIYAQENERKRISRELHDVIAQALVGINLGLTAFESNPDPESVADLRLMVDQTVESVHRFARELRPAMLDELGLLPALRSFLKDFLETTGLRANLRVSSAVENLGPEVRTTLFRIAQEALANVAAHARAESVAIEILIRDDTVAMEITDDGQGFDTSLPVNPQRLGLIGMRERAEMAGGEFSVTSSPSGPTRIHVSLPNPPNP